MLISWAFFLLELGRVRFPWLKYRHAFAFAGSVQIFMGLYLYFWVFVLMSPANVLSGDLWRYATSDMLQLQHMAISGLLFTAGVIELCWSCKRLRQPAWNIVWCALSFMIGIVFLMHPQQTPLARVMHSFLGTSLIMGAFFYFTCKMRGVDADDIDWDIVAAGIMYATAGLILVAFKESPEERHKGHGIHCQGAYPITLACILVPLPILPFAVWAATNYCSCFGETTLRCARRYLSPFGLFDDGLLRDYDGSSADDDDDEVSDADSAPGHSMDHGPYRGSKCCSCCLDCFGSRVGSSSNRRKRGSAYTQASTLDQEAEFRTAEMATSFPDDREADFYL
jgi:uncharacterized membrane protein HdeD (DUF308 family)